MISEIHLPVPPAELPANLSDRVIVDCDEVLLKWHPGFRLWFERTYGQQLNSPEPEDYNLGGWLPKAHRHRAMELIGEFSRSDEFFGNLEPTDGAIEFVSRSREKGYKLHMLSACSTDREVRAARVSNLEKVFGADAFEDILLIELGASKSEELRRHPRSLWLDDLPKHVRSGIEAGHHGVVVAASHNHGLRAQPHMLGLPWIDRLSDLTPLLRGKHADLPEVAFCIERDPFSTHL